MNDDEPLDHELAELFDAERAEHVPEPMALAEVLARVDKALLLATLAAGATASAPAANVVAGPSSAVASTALRTKVTVALVAAIAFGGGAVVGRKTAEKPAVAPALAPSAVTVAPSASPSGSAPVEPAPNAGVVQAPLDPHAPTAPRASVAAPPDPVGELAKEQALVDTARAALARGRPADALGAVEAHAHKYPRGRLAEEREALAVQALTAAGRGEEARSRAERFHRTFPQSIFGPAVDRSAGGK